MRNDYQFASNVGINWHEKLSWDLIRQFSLLFQYFAFLKYFDAGHTFAFLFDRFEQFYAILQFDYPYSWFLFLSFLNYFLTVGFLAPALYSIIHICSIYSNLLTLSYLMNLSVDYYSCFLYLIHSLYSLSDCTWHFFLEWRCIAFYSFLIQNS